jgi:ABC-type phosphate/phosphonate transport system substrate-binding protein
MPKQLTLSYYPWITQSISGQELRDAIDAFRAVFEEKLKLGLGNDIQLKLQNVMEIPAQLKDLEAVPAGDVVAKIGLLNPLGYAVVHKRTPTIEAVALIRRKGVDGKPGSTYYAQLYTHRQTFVKKKENMKVSDVQGHSLAFGSPQSTSNFLVPAKMLLTAKIHPLNGLSRVEFTGGHDKAAAAVYEGRLEVGAGHDGAISGLAGKPGYSDANEVLVQIAKSDPILSDPVAVHTRDSAVRDEIRKALLEVAKPGEQTSKGNQIVKRFWDTEEGFEAVAPEAYNSLRKIMSELALSDEHMKM